MSRHFETPNVINRENIWMYLYNDGDEKPVQSRVGLLPDGRVGIESLEEPDPGRLSPERRTGSS